MISKCHLSGMITEISRLLILARSFPDNPNHRKRLVRIDNTLYELYLTNTISVKTLIAIRDPITDFESTNGFRLLSRYNNSIYG